MVLVQIWPFLKLFLLRQFKPGKYLFSILGQKNAFLGYKTKSSKSRKIHIFPKRLTHGFGPKMAIIQTFFFRHDRHRKVLLRYSRTKKKPFLSIKTRSSKSRKIDFFLKELTHGFGLKMAISTTFFF